MNMCLYSKLIKNPKYLPNKKNGYNPPECKDERLRYVPAKCGRCIECRKEKKRNWRIRMSEELKKNPKAIFVTLTFNQLSMQLLCNELFKGKQYEKLNYEEENELCTKATRRFLERIRKETGKSVKHWLITEKGEDFGRIHLHGIMWCEKNILKHWGYGYNYCGQFVNDATINYITKYILKQIPKYKGFQGKILCSAGIGKGYDGFINKWREKDTNENYKLRNGEELPLPKYYHDKIFSEEQREKLWIWKQERGYKYVGGEKVPTDDLELWNNLTDYYQRRGQEVFGDDPVEWDKQKEAKKLVRWRRYVEKCKKSVNK